MKRYLLCLYALLLALSVGAASAEELVITATLPEVVVIPGGETNNDALFDAYVEGLFAIPRRRLMKAARSVGSRLTGMDAAYYSALRSAIEEVAAGDRTSTVFEFSPEELGLDAYSYTAAELGVDAIVADDAITPAASAAFSQRLAEENAVCNLSYLLDVLLADCPYSLYWYEKTVGTALSQSIAASRTGGEWRISVGRVTFRFPVALGYAAGDPVTETRTTSSGNAIYVDCYYHTDDTQVDAANDAVALARSIVADHAGESDYAKLNSYRREICDLVSYNKAALTSGASYGDPWQLVYVFDGDPTTNVVCEGYSKAFQYLCELSAFRDSVNSYIVTGTMRTTQPEGENHMWNLVTMPDGNNYLVDVTNCDAGSVGAPDKLFLVGYSRHDKTSEYIINPSWSNWVTYVYDDDTMQMYTAEELAVASASYVPPVEIPNPSSLTTLTLPEGLTTLEASALEGVAAQRVLLPAGLKTIESRAFADCPNLIYINLPAGLESIAPDAFADCAADRIFVECAGDTAENAIFSADTRLYAIR